MLNAFYQKILRVQMVYKNFPHVFALLVSLFLPGAVLSGISVVGGLTYEKNVQPGESFQGVILLKNSNASPKEVKLYQTDYQFSIMAKMTMANRENCPAPMPPGSPSVRIARSCRPKSTTGINYAVTVPKSGDLTGSYWSMLMVEEIAHDLPEASTQENRQLQLAVRQIRRLGIQTVTHIGDSGTRKLKFVNTAQRRVRIWKRT